MTSKTGDNGTIGASEAVDIVTIGAAELDALVDERAREIARGNPAPAIEEGPHLADPTNAAAKREQLLAAGVDDPDVETLTREMLTDDMLAALDAPDGED